MMLAQFTFTFLSLLRPSHSPNFNHSPINITVYWVYDVIYWVYDVIYHGRNRFRENRNPCL